MKYLFLILTLLLVGCNKPPSLDFGERYLVKNYDEKKRDQIKKHFKKKKKRQLNGKSYVNWK